MTKQLYNKGDLVRVAKDLGSMMSHFTNDCDAIVIGSYCDQYGGGRENPSYTIHIKDGGETSWYDEWQLTLIEADMGDLLAQWEKEKNELAEKVSSLDWIFKHGEDVIAKPHGASVQALANCFGLTSLWGERGEGIDYYSNSRQTLDLATPFLKIGDKDGWLELCKTITMTLMDDKCINRPLKIQAKKAN